MKKKIAIGLVIILVIAGVAANKLIFDQRGQDGSLPKETLLLQKKYIEEQLKKYHYDYEVKIDLGGYDYGILWIEMYKGDCDVVGLLFGDPKDEIMEYTATTHPEVCFNVKK